jgi:hypothetical protein
MMERVRGILSGQEEIGLGDLSLLAYSPEDSEVKRGA